MLKIGAILILTLFLTAPAWSNTVKQVKGQRVLMELSTPDDFAEGDRVFALDDAGKRKGLITIEKIKGERALGKVSKGSVQPNATLAKAGGGATSKKPGKSSSNKKFALGIMAGGAYDTMSVKVSTATGVLIETINMSGTGFSIKAVADYDFTSYLGLRLFLGMEQFNTSAKAQNPLSCDGGACKTEISYITLDAWGRYALTEGSSKIWLGAGAGLLSPGAKTSNALDKESIGSTFAFYLGGGVDFKLDGDLYIPTQVDYAILPSSEQVTAAIIAVRFGIAKRF